MDLSTVAAAGIAALVTAMVGAYIALQKLRPDTATVFVTAAQSLVVSQSTVLQETVQRYEETQAANEALKVRLDALEADQASQNRLLEEQRTKVTELHGELEQMHEELASLTQSRDQARNELRAAKTEVDRLRARVLLLEERLASHGLPIPSPEELDGPPSQEEPS